MTTPAQQLETAIAQSLGEVIYGMSDTITGLSVCLIAQGHALLEGAPGLGKTLVAKSLARRLGRSFSRVQCTADLMPTDLTGIHIFRKDSSEFELVPGPLFADVVLVDEINRTGPKTQSALLQAMEERTISLDRKTYKLSGDMLVVATQNPHEFEGTYPLLESQLDRFLLKMVLQYPDAATEKKILAAYDGAATGHQVKDGSATSIDPELIARAREQSAAVHIADPVYDYATQIAHATRSHPAIDLGLSTRGLLALMRSARAVAAMRGSDFMIPDDIKNMTSAVVGHRLILSAEASLDDVDVDSLIHGIVESVEIPRQAA